MADTNRTLMELDEYLRGAGALRTGEALSIFKEVVGHMIRQQKEIDELKKRGLVGDAGGTPIVRQPDGKVYL